MVPAATCSGTAATRTETGIPVGDKLWAELVTVSESLGVALPATVEVGASA